MQAFMDFQTKGRVERKTINTKHILFIVSGAFNGLTEIIKKRVGAKQIGFMGEKPSADGDSARSASSHRLYRFASQYVWGWASTSRRIEARSGA